MTIFTVIWIVVLVACGYVVAGFFDEPLMRMAMFFAGFFAPILIYRLTLLVIDRCDILPMCRNKKCGTKRYSVKGRVEGSVYYVCKCGDVYLYTPERHFKFIDKDGVTHPYRIKIDGAWWPAPEVFEKQ